MLEKDEYYEIGDINNIVLSQSALKEIDPKYGSPRKLKSFFEDKREKQSLPMLRGSVFHLYNEHKDAFHISDDVKPGGALGDVCDLIMLKYNSLDEQSQEELILMLDQNVLNACRTLNWNKNWGDSAIIKNAAGVNQYILAVTNPANKGKIILTSVLKEQIEKCIASLTANEHAYKLLFWRSEFDNIDFFKELEVYWEETINDRVLKFKGKIDDVLVNHDTKVITVTDLKTTGSSAYNFLPTFNTYRLDLQFFVYAKAIKKKFPEYKDYKLEFKNVVVETNGLYQTVVHSWSIDIIKEAKAYFIDLCERVLLAIDNDFTLSKEEVEGKGEIIHLLENDTKQNSSN